jgi:putative ABC transport system permease protein
VEAAKAAYAKQDNQNPFEARAVSEVVAQVINPFVDVGKVLVFIALIAVAIGIVGLVSMTTFSVGVRMREIGIRKALGATVPGLVYQLSSEYVWLVGLGTVIAAPLAWLLNRTWLQNLAVSVDVGVVTLAGVSLGMILLAVTTVAPQTVRAALTSPARVLRDE